MRHEQRGLRSAMKLCPVTFSLPAVPEQHVGEAACGATAEGGGGEEESQSPAGPEQGRREGEGAREGGGREGQALQQRVFSCAGPEETEERQGSL